ncbi:MAG: flagellar biosynthetic protein FliO [Cyanobacteria bacterium]|nr:flagellar biosynthetic protein FliO [Cyanobacteriota bacterium]
MTGSSGHETQILWQYVGSFTLYTLLAIGVMYGAYFWIKSQGSLPAGLAAGLPKGLTGLLKIQTPGVQNPIQIESRLSLELRKQLYIIRCGSERFLIATSNEGTQLISKLDDAKASDNSALFPPEGGTTIINPISSPPSAGISPKTTEAKPYGPHESFFSRALSHRPSVKKAQQSPQSCPQPAFFF